MCRLGGMRCEFYTWRLIWGWGWEGIRGLGKEGGEGTPGETISTVDGW